MLSNIGLRAYRRTASVFSLALAASACGSASPSGPAASRIASIRIVAGESNLIFLPLGERERLTIQTRAADGSLVNNFVEAMLVSRDTTSVIVEPGNFVRMLPNARSGDVVVVATLAVDRRSLRDSVRVRLIVPLGGVSAVGAHMLPLH